MVAEQPSAGAERREWLLFDNIEARLEGYMKNRVEPEEIATTFNFILEDEFSKAGLKPVFVGQYRVDRNNPEQTRVYSHHGTEACSPIPINRGVIGRMIRTGKDQYVPDVTDGSSYVSYDFIHGNKVGEPVKDPGATHIQCDGEMEGSELVLGSWSDPYAHGEYAGCRVTLAVLDIDLNVKGAFSEAGIRRMRNIWDKWGKRIFPGEAAFTPEGEFYVEKARK